MSVHLFNFSEFIEEQRNNPEEKNKIEEYERYYGPIPPSIEQQIWYRTYVSKFLPYTKGFHIPEEVEEDFDWDLLIALIVSSFSSKYVIKRPNRIFFRPDDKAELQIFVGKDDQEVTKSLSELWSFQIFRLFEIYIKEQIGMQTILAECDGENVQDILKERLQRIELISTMGAHLPYSGELTVSSQNDTTIYHYTSFNAFSQIIKNNNFRASDPSRLNDKREYKIWFDVFEQACCTLREREDANEYVEIIDEIKKRVSEFGQYSHFVTCFSQGRDLLSQWRAYGDVGSGVCIGLDLDKMLSIMYENEDNYDPNNRLFLLHGPIEYNDEVVYKDIYNHILDILKDYRDSGYLFKEYTNLVDKVDFLQKSCEKIFMRMQDLKDGSFWEEKEYRFFLMQSSNNPRKKKEYFERRWAYIPYVELSAGKSKFPIKEIIVGPTARDQNMLIESIKDCLRSNGYDISTIQIVASKAPLRIVE
ncbi:hypothetical protein HR17_00420 [Porphyromonas gulae]|uniref:DUF2971 domain-containing protein n=1 Tax=Porphyromonas gulae TaxID=111105 RepID=UPI00052C3AE5|nr:DUF2971 domain-containing protein [Porphyromonas gulae]KGN77150.1 hypothetical protein HR17_00420 [Porphyromonas gulae]